MFPLKGTLSRMQNNNEYSLNSSIRESSSSARDVQPNLTVYQNEKRDEYELGAYGYGKNNVKLLYVRRDNALHHEIREYEVDTHLRLISQKDYMEGDNHDIIATDSQKNTVYLMAKKHGIRSPEEFALLLCSHFLYTYEQIAEVSINVEEYPWSRHYVDKVPHNHAFVMSPTATRYCQVSQLRNESPRIRGGLKGLRLLKTTQSSFTDFIQDDYRTLPDMNDRIFSTVVTTTWDFSTATGVDFDKVWYTVRDCIMENFAGPPDTGIYSPSVQNTLYLTEKSILDKVKQIHSIEMQMPNKHYFDLDLSKFSKLVQGQNKEVYLPMDKPSDLNDAPLPWWETDYVKYGISYVPVRSRLTMLMGSHVVRLTDRKYMMQLASKLQEDYETRQKIRIEQRKLKTISIVPKLRELPCGLLPKEITPRPHPCTPKFHAEAAKKCKQLPALLLADDLQKPSETLSA